MPNCSRCNVIWSGVHVCITTEDKLRTELHKVKAENEKLRRVADAARALRVDGKGLSIMEANQLLDDALAALDAEGEGEK